MKKILITFFLLTASAWATMPSPTPHVRALAEAIARTEGYYVKGSLPNRHRNPGDIRASKGIIYPGQIGIDRRRYVIFANDRAGWNALYSVLQKVITGESKYYTVNMSLRQLAKHYATSKIWVRNVSKILAVTPDTKLWEVLDVAPRLEEAWL